MSTLRTSLCDLLAIDVPILQAGMGLVSYAELAAAAANAGAFGCLGGIDIPLHELESEIKKFRGLSDRPLGVDLGFPERAPTGLRDVVVPDPLPEPVRVLRKELAELGVEVRDDEPDQAISRDDNMAKLEICLDHGVETIVCGLGTPVEVVELAKSRGANVMSIVGTARAARKVQDNGTDAIIVQGTEGGGHSGFVGTSVLLAEVLEFARVPVIAAGGITTGAQIAGYLTAGAEGVWIGTRFLVSKEGGSEDAFKRALVSAGPSSTVHTPIFDGLHVRSLRNRFITAWEGKEDQYAGYPVQRRLMIPIRDAAARAEQADYMNLACGQGVSLINDIPSAGDLVHRLVDETVQALAASAKRISYTL